MVIFACTHSGKFSSEAKILRNSSAASLACVKSCLAIPASSSYSSSSRVINFDLPDGPLAPILEPVPFGRPLPRFSPLAAVSSSAPTLIPSGLTRRVTFMPVSVFSISCLWPAIRSPVFILLISPMRFLTSFCMSSQPSSTSSFSISRILPMAFFIALAATSPNISSTSFFAPAILSAKVILSFGSANAAKLLSAADIPSSFTGYSLPPTLIFSPG